MNKKLNVKLVVGLCLGTFLTVVSVFFLHRYQVRRNADVVLVRAEAAANKGDWKEVVRLRKRYLQHRPNDLAQLKQLALDAKRMALGTEVPNLKDLREALNLMEVAVRENINDVDLRREMASFWMTVGRFNDAKDHLELIEESGQATVNDQLLLARCLVHIGGVQETKAVELLEKMIGYDPVTGSFDPEKATHPENVHAYALLAAIHRDKRLDNAAADAVMEQLVKINDESHEARLERARHWQVTRPGTEGLELAQADIKKAMELAPDDELVILAYADVVKLAAQYDEAQQHLDRGLQKFPKSSAMYRSLSDLAIRQNDKERAMEYVEQGLKAIPSDKELLWAKAQLQIDQGLLDEAAKTAEQLQKQGSYGALIEFINARSLVAKKQWMEASKKLEKLRPLVNQLIAVQIDLLLSQCYENLSQPDARLNALRRFIGQRPEYMPAHIGIAESLWRLGRIDEALDKFNEIKHNYDGQGKEVPNFITTSIAELKVRKQEQLPADERNWGDVQAEANNLWRDENLDRATKLRFIIQLFQKQGKHDQAVKYAEQGIAEYPEEFGLWVLRLQLAKDNEEGESILAKMQQQFDDTVLLRLARASWITDNRASDARGELKKLEQNVAKYSPVERQRLFEGLGREYLKLRDSSETTRLWEMAAAEVPNNLTIRTMLYELAMTREDPAVINAAVARIKEVAGEDDETWKMAEAGRIVWMVRHNRAEKSQLARARNLVEQVRRDRPDWIPVLLMEADIQTLQGAQDAAVQALERALSLQPNNPRILRDLANRYSVTGRLKEAEELIARLADHQRSELDDRRRIAILERTGDIAAALSLAEKVIPADSSDAVDQFTRSRLLAKSNRWEESEQAARAALDAAPGLPEAWGTLVRLLVAQNKLDDAEAVIQEADFKLPEQQKPLIMGQLCAVVGDFQRAQTYYLSALHRQPDSTRIKRLIAELYFDAKQPAQAQRYLDEILVGAEPNAAEIPVDVAWARRALARIKALSGSYADFEDALETIEQNVPAGGEMAPDDLALWVGLAAQRPEASSRGRAIARLEQMQQQGRLTDELQFILAQLYYLDGQRWSDVSRLMLDLLAHNTNQQYVDKWVGWLLKQASDDPDMLRQAEMWKNQLPSGSITRIRVEAHKLAEQQKHQQAARQLLGLIPQDIKPQDYVKLVAVAAMIEELVHYDARYYVLAEQQLEKLVEKEPGEVLRLAALKGRHGGVNKLDEGLGMCEQSVRDGVPPVRAAAEVVAMLRAHDELDSTSTQFQRAEKWLEALAAASPKDYALLSRIAEFHDMAGHSSRVKELYRTILDGARLRPQDKGMILNNLAYVHALDGEGNEALSLVNNAIQLFGPTTDLLDTRGYAYLQLNQVDKAITDFQQAISGGGKTAHKLFHLALAQERNRDDASAEKSWREALGLGLEENQLPRQLRDDYLRLRAKFGELAMREKAFN